MSTLDWQKSSYSGDQANCLYVATGTDTAPAIHLRESDDATTLTTTPKALAALIHTLSSPSPSPR
ncbi:DUF397 domain-containing protein [Streptomyces sp. NPDC046465]|uniref:DUF397 domain-containing protein n=1 Tax=Streptomyces sp. NPDC046465 TaxID=3155810 RepID=UPI0033D1983A